MALTGRLLLHVVIWREQAVVAREDFLARHIIVGQDPTRADLVLADDDVADEHALLEHDGEWTVVHNLSGAHPMFVNGAAVVRAQVGPTDEVQLGNHVLRMCVLNAAAAQRWQQTIAHDDLAVPPTMRATSAGEAVPQHPAELQSGVPDWLLLHVPQATREALLAPLPADATAALRCSAVRAPGRHGLALLKMGHALEDYRIVRRSYTVPKSYASVGRYDEPKLIPSPLQISRQGPAAALAVVPTGLPWVLHRADGVYDEQAGVRENWAHRGRSHVRIKLDAADELHVRVEPTTYVVRLVPLPEPPQRTRVTWELLPWRAWASRWRPLAAGVLAVATMGLVVALMLFQRSQLHRGQRAMLGPPVRQAAALLEAHFLPPTGPEGGPGQVATPPSWPADAAANAGRIGVPGGSHGYRLFGLLMPQSLADAAQAPGAPGLEAPERAWLRGHDVPFGKVLKSVLGGPPWLLDCDASDVQVSEARLSAARVAQWLLAQPDLWLTCYDRSRPPKQQVKMGVTMQLAAAGRVRRVRALAGARDASWVRCLEANKAAFRPPRFVGADVTVRATVTLWPWPTAPL